MPHSAAYSPSHVTGFFEILDKDTVELKRGSQGAGISLAKGVRTRVSARRSLRNQLTTRINGQETADAGVSELVARTFLEMASGAFSVEIDHDFDVPMETGFGTSGAGALSLSLALDEALRLGLSPVESAQIAHRAEIACRTGLGTVIAETYGGIEVRVKPGAPGVGRVMNLPSSKDSLVCAATLGPISTTHILSTPWMRDRINGHARDLLWELIGNPTTQQLMMLSRRFSDGIGLATPGVKKLQRIFDELQLPVSMLMMGEGVFSILAEEETENVLRILRKKAPTASIVVSKIAEQGARLLDS